MSVSITPVILCGGSGTRLWPRSRPSAPKPFLPLLGEVTLFEEAIERCDSERFQHPVIVTGEAHLALVKRYSADRTVREIIVEPGPRQTAAAAALAALRLPAASVMLVCPSDHHISDIGAFTSAAARAAELAAKGFLVCIGVPPSRGETRFGYIRKGQRLEDRSFRVERFVEKPEATDAAGYADDGDHFWNSGVFAMRAGDYLDELARHRPQIAASAEAAIARGKQHGIEFHPDAASFGAIAPESIDYAVMENSDRVAVVGASDMGWSDVGDWRALHQLRERDGAGNSARGAVELLDCRDLLVETDGPRVHAIGLANLVIIVDGDDILVADAGEASRASEFARRSGK